MPDKFFAEWQDVQLSFVRYANYVGTPAGMAAYRAALQAASNAALTQTTQGAFTVGTGTPVDATFPLLQDVAAMTFTTGLSTVRVTVPAPVAALFKTDLVTVDPTDPTGFLAAVIGGLGDVLGNPVTAFVQGVRPQSPKGVQ